MVTPTDGPPQNHANRHNPTNQTPRPSFRAALSPLPASLSPSSPIAQSHHFFFSFSLSLSLLSLFFLFFFLSSLRRFFVIPSLSFLHPISLELRIGGFFHRYPLFILLFILPRPFVSLFSTPVRGCAPIIFPSPSLSPSHYPPGFFNSYSLLTILTSGQEVSSIKKTLSVNCDSLASSTIIVSGSIPHPVRRDTLVRRIRVVDVSCHCIAFRRSLSIFQRLLK